jgi:hypothetical protein
MSQVSSYSGNVFSDEELKLLSESSQPPGFRVGPSRLSRGASDQRSTSGGGGGHGRQLRPDRRMRSLLEERRFREPKPRPAAPFPAQTGRLLLRCPVGEGPETKAMWDRKSTRGWSAPRRREMGALWGRAPPWERRGMEGAIQSCGSPGSTLWKAILPGPVTSRTSNDSRCPRSPPPKGRFVVFTSTLPLLYSRAPASSVTLSRG